MLLLIGHSASGKTEIANLLAKNFGIKKIVTYTTRQMRKGEVDGKDYHFCSEEKFLALKEKKFFAETTYFNGFYYGTAKKDIRDDRVLIVDPVGLDNFKKLNLDNLYAIFLEANRNVRFNRMIARGDDHENAIKRLEHDQEKFSLDKLRNIDQTVDTNVFSINYLTNLVFELYQNSLKGKSSGEEE